MLILEVKGDCSVREVLEQCGREEDYLELDLAGDRRWNLLDTPVHSREPLSNRELLLRARSSGAVSVRAGRGR